jgi:type I restriction enzyme S subunit
MRYRLKHLVKNPIVKSEVSDAGRIDLEDIASGGPALVTAEEVRRRRTGEGVRFERGDVLFGKLRPYLSMSLLVSLPGYVHPSS